MHGAPRRARAERGDRPARVSASREVVRHLRAAVAEELCDRQRPLSARLLHDEAQSAPQRKDGAAAGLRRHPPAAAASRPCQGALELIDTLGALAEDLDRHAGVGVVARAPGAHGELCGMMTIRAALEARGDARQRVLVPESAHGTNPATAALAATSVDAIPARCARPGRPRGARSQARARCCRADADQPQHLRPVRGRDHRDRRGGASRPAPIFIATAPISTRSSGACGRPTSASTACTSICTRPSRPRMAAAARAAARSC